MKTSIFNDVIGPVMRGPSSSHTAASHRIGSIIRQFCNSPLKRIIVEFDTRGSLATTYEGQGSSMGLISGLAGLTILDPSIKNFSELPARHNFEIAFRITDYEANHPNTYKVHTESGENEKNDFVALSTGGGSIIFTEINGFGVSIKGDSFYTLICYKSNDREEMDELCRRLEIHSGLKPSVSINNGEDYLIIIKSGSRLKQGTDEIVRGFKGFRWIREISPVLPVLPVNSPALPFNSIEEMLRLAETERKDLAEIAAEYEGALAGISSRKVFSLMEEIVIHIRAAIENGMKGQIFADRIIGHQAHLLGEAEKNGKIIKTPLNSIVSYVTAIMESKSSMDIIVAAPTAGSCGVLGGAVFGVSDYAEITGDSIVKAFLAAGIVGVFIAERYTFAAEEGGCQVECGAASAMAAAALVQLMGGDAKQAVNASSMALQNCLGLICDPVADRVEVPCLGKNILAATNALNSANMAIAGYDPVIPLEEVIDAMKSVGEMMPRALCCTGLGGLSQTPTSLRLLKKMTEQDK